MIKIRGRSQIGNLTPDHKSLESRVQMRSHWNLVYTIGKIFSNATKYCSWIFEINLIWERYKHPKVWDIKSPGFGTLTWESWENLTFGCGLNRKAQSILYGGEWCLLPKVVGRVKLVFEVVPIKSIVPLSFNLH